MSCVSMIELHMYQNIVLLKPHHHHSKKITKNLPKYRLFFFFFNKSFIVIKFQFQSIIQISTTKGWDFFLNEVTLMKISHQIRPTHPIGAQMCLRLSRKYELNQIILEWPQQATHVPMQEFMRNIEWTIGLIPLKMTGHRTAGTACSQLFEIIYLIRSKRD